MRRELSVFAAFESFSMTEAFCPTSHYGTYIKKLSKFLLELFDSFELMKRYVLSAWMIEWKKMLFNYIRGEEQV